jgi:hypothetical protein
LGQAAGAASVLVAASLVTAPVAEANPSPAWSPIYFPTSGTATVDFQVPAGAAVASVLWVEEGSSFTDTICDSVVACQAVRYKSAVRPAGTAADLLVNVVGQAQLLLADYRNFTFAAVSDTESTYRTFLGSGANPFVVNVTSTPPPPPLPQPEVPDPVLPPAPVPPPVSAPGPVTNSVTSPDLRVVGYIAPFSVGACAKNIGLSVLPRPAIALCPILNSTANRTPGDLIAASEQAWAQFLSGREYRPVINLPRYTLRCSNGKPVEPPTAASRAYDAPTADNPAFRSFGYTPVGGHRLYLNGDPYREPRYRSDAPMVSADTLSATGTIDFRVAVRASNLESVGNIGATTDALPFVWSAVRVTLGCNGSVAAEVYSSDTPTTKIYRDGVLVYTKSQTADWASFLKDGSSSRDPRRVLTGHGVLDSHCSRITFSGYSDSAQPVERHLTRDDCRSFTAATR